MKRNLMYRILFLALFIFSKTGNAHVFELKVAESVGTDESGVMVVTYNTDKYNIDFTNFGGIFELYDLIRDSNGIEANVCFEAAYNLTGIIINSAEYTRNGEPTSFAVPHPSLSLCPREIFPDNSGDGKVYIRRYQLPNGNFVYAYYSRYHVIAGSTDDYLGTLYPYPTPYINSNGNGNGTDQVSYPAGVFIEREIDLFFMVGVDVLTPIVLMNTRDFDFDIERSNNERLSRVEYYSNGTDVKVCVRDRPGTTIDGGIKLEYYRDVRLDGGETKRFINAEERECPSRIFTLAEKHKSGNSIPQNVFVRKFRYQNRTLYGYYKYFFPDESANELLGFMFVD